MEIKELLDDPGEDSIAAICPEYQEMLWHWSPIYDLLGGTPAMRKAGQRWLPMMGCEDEQDYRTKLGNAVLEPAFENIVESLADKPFCQAIQFEGGELPDPLKCMAECADGSDQSITQFARGATFDAAAYGLTHILTDHPPNPGELSLKDQIDRGITPYMVNIKAVNLFYWRRVRTNSGKDRLVEIRYLTHRERTKGLGIERYPVIVRWLSPSQLEGGPGEDELAEIRASQGGRPLPSPGLIEYWIHDEEDKVWKIDSTSSHTFPGIPLETVYFRRTGFMSGLPPFRHAAWLNITLWQSAAQQRRYLDYTRIPILWLEGADATEAEITIGVGHVNSAGGNGESAKLSFVEPRGNAADGGWKDIEGLRSQIEAIGNQPFTRAGAGTSETATGKSIDESGFQADAQSMVRQVERGLLGSLKNAATWINLGGGEGVVIDPMFRVKIFDKFGITQSREVDLQELRRARENGDLPQDTYLHEIGRRGVIMETTDIQDVVARSKTEREERARLEAEAKASAQPANRSGEGNNFAK